MSQESIAEAMMEKKQWWTPFPKGALYGAAGRRDRLCDGREHRGAGGQFTCGDDPADAFL